MVFSVIPRVEHFSEGDSFTIVYVSGGTSPARIADTCSIIAAPCCVCLNERESFSPEGSLEGFTVRFHPSHLNSALNFSNITGDQSGMPESAVLDRYFLRPFIERDEIYHGTFNPGPETDITLRTKLSRLSADHADTLSPYHPCRQRSSLMDLLLTLVTVYRASNATPKSVSGDEFCARVAAWLTEHYAERVTIPELCARFSINRTDLSARFRAATGLTLIEYLSRVRIDMACRLLRETMLPTGDILYRVGFNDTAHFIRTFKKITGMSPRQFRNSHSAANSIAE